MSFTSRNGTRGARQPRNGALMRWAKKRWINRIERSGGKFMGMNVLVLTTVGKKTGMERQTPLGWFPAPAGTWFIVASAAGAAKNPAWYYNLAASPTKARVTMGGSEVPVTARQLHGVERDRAWEQIVAAVPRYAQYETKTDRDIPVIQLTPAEPENFPPEESERP
jgi:deazaflavin-dependent oxidoreductase (nitroreductase family)